MTIRLTKVAKRAGCAAKHPPGYLFPLLKGLPPVTDPRVMVGSATADDAAVYRLTDDIALVLTTDFFTPVVDDPFDFGRVAATNAISDVYAMGGTPITALNIVGFPDELLDGQVLARILEGGADSARKAGIDIVGGHTIKTDEPIYGLSVTGTVSPKRVLSNAGAKAGDALVLTKPIGIGIVTTAAKQDQDSLNAIGSVVELMATLNRSACEAMLASSAHACTDITGFGLLGHLRNMTVGSGLAATIHLSEVPFIEAAKLYVAQGICPGGTHANLRYLKELVTFEVNNEAQLLLCDAQTSGGLLIALPEKDADALIRELTSRGTACAARIGTLHDGPPGSIRVIA
jgi:selenide, water dikinase